MDELRVPLDGDGFSRRECPRCGAHFKLRWSGREAHLLAAALGRRLEHDGDAESCAPRFCPYCACTADADAFLTGDVQRQLDGEASRIAQEVRSRRLLLPAEWAGANPRARSHAATAPERRPPPRADPVDELLPIALPCCGEEQKVNSAWMGPIRCHLCGIAHLRAGPRDIGLELALLLQWTQEP
jgi:hypothetical protein